MGSTLMQGSCPLQPPACLTPEADLLWSAYREYKYLQQRSDLVPPYFAAPIMPPGCFRQPVGVALACSNATPSSQPPGVFESVRSSRSHSLASTADTTTEETPKKEN